MSWTYADWYGKNREKLNAKRRARYEEDVKYRKKAIASSRKYQKATKREKLPPGVVRIEGKEFGTVSRLGLAIRRRPATVRGYERSGILPVALWFTTAGHRLYSPEQITLAAWEFRKWERGEQTREVMIRRIKGGWNA